MFAFGISAALAAPLVMTLGFIVWDNHWKGSAFALNLFKCNLASMVFVVLSLTTRRGDVFPDQVFTLQKVGFLMLSSTIGIIIGDWTWLEGLKLLGARRVIVVDTCKPFLAALLGWAFLGENLRPPAFGGMALTVGGVLLVSWEEAKEEEEEEETTYSTKEVGCADSSPTMTTPLPSEENSLPQTQECTGDNEEEEQRTFDLSNGGEDDHAGDERIEEEKVARSEGRTKTASDLRRGYTMSVLNVVLDTFGSLLTKEYGVGMTVWEIGLIRFGFAGVVMLAVSALLRKGRRRCLEDRRGETRRQYGQRRAVVPAPTKHVAPFVGTNCGWCWLGDVFDTKPEQLRTLSDRSCSRLDTRFCRAALRASVDLVVAIGKTHSKSLSGSVGCRRRYRCAVVLGDIVMYVRVN